MDDNGFRDFYKILGVDPSVTTDDIKKAYRKKALAEHPDRHDSKKKAEQDEKFSEVNDAYTVLSDPKSRSNYDKEHQRYIKIPQGSSDTEKKDHDQRVDEIVTEKKSRLETLWDETAERLASLKPENRVGKPPKFHYQDTDGHDTAHPLAKDESAYLPMGSIYFSPDKQTAFLNTVNIEKKTGLFKTKIDKELPPCFMTKDECSLLAWYKLVTAHATNTSLKIKPDGDFTAPKRDILPNTVQVTKALVPLCHAQICSRIASAAR